MEAILFAVLLVGGLVVFDLAAMRWSVSSIEGPDNIEWKHRRDWRGFRRR